MRALTDEHISPKVARVVYKLTGYDFQSLHTWCQGIYLSESDEVILTAAAKEGRLLFTYDLRTIPRLLVEWEKFGKSHGGVVLIDEKTFPPEKIGALAKGITHLLDQETGRRWRNHVSWLEK